MSTSHISTTQLASEVGIRPKSIIVALCRRGHYCGIKPLKLKNGRLLWPANSLELITKGER